MDTPDPAEVFRTAFDARLANVHVAGFGKVTSYNAAARRADVKVGWKRAVPTDVEGEFVTEVIPDLPSVPVIHFGGAAAYLRTPLAAGDTVLILVCDTDQTTWLRTGEVSDPGDLRRFHLSHAVAIPWAKSAAPADPDLKAANAHVGGSVDEASLASKVATELNAIAAALDALALAIPATNPYTAAANTVAAIRARIRSTALKLGS